LAHLKTKGGKMSNKIVEIFQGCGAVTEGHFVLTSGEHSAVYVDKDNLYKHPTVFNELCFEIADQVQARSINVDVVVGPVSVGPVIPQNTAYYLSNMLSKEVICLFTEKDKIGGQTLRPSFRKDLRGKNVLVVDDILTTGGTIRSIFKMATIFGGKVKGVVVLCNRGGLTSSDFFGFPLISLLQLKLESYPEKDCPLCAARVPINSDVGHGKEFLITHPGYPSI